MLLLSEARAAKRARQKSKQQKKFVASLPAPIPHGEFLEMRAKWLFCVRRLWIINQHPERDKVEAAYLVKVRDAIAMLNPSIADGLRDDVECIGTYLEI
jgi:hypothetical protein